MFYPVLERLYLLSTEEDGGIMKHSWQGFQGFNYHFIHAWRSVVLPLLWIT